MCTDWTFIAVVIVVASVFLLLLLLLFLFLFIVIFFLPVLYMYEYPFLADPGTMATVDKQLHKVRFDAPSMIFESFTTLLFQGVIKVINRDESYL